MGWWYGIPDFSLAQRFTYYNDLLDISENTLFGAIKKVNLWFDALGTASEAISALTAQQSIDNATQFLSQIATSERAKELAAVQQYCTQTGKQFPLLEPYLQNPSQILDDPQSFYSILTAAINEAHRNTQDYLYELRRIQENLKTKGRTLQNYKKEDYRYRFAGSVSSFLHRLIGNYNLISDEKSENNYTLKIQQLTMRILNNANIPQRMKSGEDFAAIAAATLADVEKIVEREMNKPENQQEATSSLSKKFDQILDEVEKRYTIELSKKQLAESPVQRALADITGIDFKRITDNAKEILNIQNITDTKELEKQLNKIKNNNKTRSKNTKTIRNAVKEMRSQLAKNKILSGKMNTLTFSISGSAQSKQGNTFELIDGLLGTKVSGNVATDVITYNISFTNKYNTKLIDELIDSIGQEFSTIEYDSKDDTESNLRDLRESLERMNKAVDNLIKKTEQQLRDTGELKSNESLFIFHESFKLYSSAETGNAAHAGFSGRSLNILSYIDYMMSTNVDQFNFAIDRDTLAFLALNLSSNAVAAEARGPLEQYFSLFAGLVMFDDIGTMAKEAMDKINLTNGVGVKQIHLYNLNGIYVPASMILSYVSDAVKTANLFVDSGRAAQATITVPSSNKAYESWKTEIQKASSGNIHSIGELRPEHWQAVGAESASSTKIKITFLAAFKDFINSLPL